MLGIISVFKLLKSLNNPILVTSIPLYFSGISINVSSLAVPPAETHQVLSLVLVYLSTPVSSVSPDVLIFFVVPSVYVNINLPFEYEISAIPLPSSPFSPFTFPSDFVVPSERVRVRVPSVRILTSLIPIPSAPLAPTTLPRFETVPSENVSSRQPFESISERVMPIPSVPLIFPRFMTVPLVRVTVSSPDEDIVTFCIPIPSFPS